MCPEVHAFLRPLCSSVLNYPLKFFFFFLQKNYHHNNNYFFIKKSSCSLRLVYQVARERLENQKVSDVEESMAGL